MKKGSTVKTLGSPGLWHILAVAFLFLAGLAIRVYDLSDPPFDYHPTRQFFTAIIARGEYYQGLTSAPQWMREQAINHWKAEQTDFPSIEALAALTYRIIGHEDLLFPRLYSVLFWLLGGLAVYFLARDLVSKDGAVLALGFYLFTPYGIIASRSFQPDPMMVCLIAYAWWAMYRWFRTRKWGWALAAGLLSGMAMLVKALAAFSILGGMVGVFFAQDVRRSIRDIRFWVMVVVAAVPMLVYMINGFFIQGGLGSQFYLRFFPALLIDPVFYLSFMSKVEKVVGLLPLLLGLLGIFLIGKREKVVVVLGLWAGYLLFAAVFAYYFMSHDYYHITLIPILAISLAPLGELVGRELRANSQHRLARAAVVLVLLAGLGVNLWDVRQVFHKADYRPQAAMYEHIGQLLGTDISGVALTDDYNYSLFYYGWLTANYWLRTGDLALRQLGGGTTEEFTQRFEDATRGKEYFLITDLAEFDAEADLKDLLYARYPILEQGDGYIIFDLAHPLP